ncbi:hypothetical protein [Sphingosinicella sp. CPCC 101087]|uniref:hypothetical protein n=1 Tax=Sphingosinicella sp. CPCC 101087 TaxID=2497754 RepID=UPI0013EA1D31|nr:hypothetical protein [Sphingosinicella sp. CPCC 101087]
MAALLLVAGCTAGDPLGLYRPYQEHHASEGERTAAFAGHQVTYGSHDVCRRKLALFVDAGSGDSAADPVRLSSIEMVGYRRFGHGSDGVIQEYRCIDNHMHFRAWVESAAEH